MSETTITVSDGTEFFRIPLSDLDEARGDGFYVPAERQRTIVSDGAELFEIPLTDLDEAVRDGFRDLLVRERERGTAASHPPTVATTDQPRKPVRPAQPIATRQTNETDSSPLPDFTADGEDLPEPEPDRRRLIGIYCVNIAIHAAAALLLLLMVIPSDFQEQFEILSALPTLEQDDNPFAETVEIQPDQIKPDTEQQVVPDLITESNELTEIDINDLELSSTIPEKKEGAGNPTAKITGELGGRSQAGRQALVEKYGGNAASEAAVGAGLQWISRHQADNGSWSFDHMHAGCKGACTQPGSLKKSPMGATAMALLSMLGSGETHFIGNFREPVYKGFDYLLTYAKQSPAGLDLRGAAEGNTGMYIQGLATMALCEAVVMSEMALKQKTRSRTKTKKNERVDRKVATASLKRLRAASQSALNFIMQAQDPGSGGWRYQPRKGGDTSVLGWQIMALRSGHTARLKILPRALEGASRYLDSVQTDNGAGYGYTGPQRRPSTTAVGLLSRMYMGWNRTNVALENGVRYLSATGPARNNMYYNYYATQVLHHWGGDEWKKWNGVMRKQLVGSQRKNDHAAGSWDVADSHGKSGGRLYMTCLCVMTLEVYYRHLPLYQELSNELGSSARKKNKKTSSP